MLVTGLVGKPTAPFYFGASKYAGRNSCTAHRIGFTAVANHDTNTADRRGAGHGRGGRRANPTAPPPPQQQPHPVARRENGQFAAPPTDFAYEPWKPQFDADEEVAEPITKNMTGL